MEPVFKNLPSKDYDYIMYQLKQLQIAKVMFPSVTNVKQNEIC